jgi:hypothetical protein
VSRSAPCLGGVDRGEGKKGGRKSALDAADKTPDLESAATSPHRAK